MHNKFIIFDNSNIRKIWFNEQWFYSIVDIICILIENDYQKARKYWNKLKQRLKEQDNETVKNCHQLKLIAKDNKLRLTDCFNSKSIFNLVEFIPSPKVEEFKNHIYELGLLKIEKNE